MISHSHVRMDRSLLCKKMWVVTIAVAAATTSLWSAGAGAAVAIWDTGSPLADTADVRDRAGWKVVPSDLLTLEADPARASMDPGHYGMEYTFAGDAVVENDTVTVAFRSADGTVAVYSRTDPETEVLEFAPLRKKARPATISRCTILQNTGDAATVAATFSGSTGPDVSIFLSLDKTQIIEIRPKDNLAAIRLQSSIEYGVIPSFVGDDLVFDPKVYPAADTLYVPSENLLLGLLEGRSRVLVMTWPPGKQQVQFGLSSAEGNTRQIDSIALDCDGQSLYLAVLEAPGIWHREKLKPSFLEKDVTIDWQRPFPAKWVTHLDEAGVKARFTFRESKGQIWRGVAGMYTYPVWFDGDSAVHRLSKKVIPRGESVIYFVEGKGTPAAIATPVDILKATLGRQVCVPILDVAGRKLRTHHRRGAEGVHRACTCGCTAVIEAVFQAGEEVERAQDVEDAVADMVYFVRVHLERLDEYRAFAAELIDFLQETGKSSSDLERFCDHLEQLVQQIPQYYETQKVNIKSLDYANELARKTVALTRKQSSENLTVCLELGKKWRSMGGAQDGLLAQYHVTVRNLFQEAGYTGVVGPEAAAVAQEIRRRCRQCLRQADGYEVWPNY